MTILLAAGLTATPLLVATRALAQDDLGDGGGAAAAVGGLCQLVIILVFSVLIIAGLWKTFTKAGKPGWAAIIPIYNAIVLLEIAGRPVWWFLLYLIPCVNIVVSFIVSIDVARKFGYGAGFGVGLALLPLIFFPILGFGKAQYNPAA